MWLTCQALTQVSEYQKDTDIKESRGPHVPHGTYLCSGFVAESRYLRVLSRDADIVPSTLHVVSNSGRREDGVSVLHVHEYAGEPTCVYTEAKSRCQVSSSAIVHRLS